MDDHRHGHGDRRSLIRTVDHSFLIDSYISFLQFYTHKIIIHTIFENRKNVFFYQNTFY
jgi:hypothetical protein